MYTVIECEFNVNKPGNFRACFFIPGSFKYIFSSKLQITLKGVTIDISAP